MENWKKHLIETSANRELAGKVGDAIEKLLIRDRDVMSLGGHERAVMHRLAVYLEKQFVSWHVDCEYNRDGERSKRNSSGKLVVPDVIVHRRNTSDNLLAIEAKKSGSPTDTKIDKKKLRDYRRKQGYQHALFLDVMLILADSEGAIEWIKHDDGR